MFTIWDNGTWKTTAVGGLKLAAGLIVALIALLQGGDTVAHLVAVLAALQGIGGFISGLVQKDANPSPAR